MLQIGQLGFGTEHGRGIHDNTGQQNAAACRPVTQQDQESACLCRLESRVFWSLYSKFEFKFILRVSSESLQLFFLEGPGVLEKDLKI